MNFHQMDLYLITRLTCTMMVKHILVKSQAKSLFKKHTSFYVVRQNKVQMLTIGKFYFVFLLGPENNFGYAFNTGYGQQQIHTNDV